MIEKVEVTTPLGLSKCLSPSAAENRDSASFWHSCMMTIRCDIHEDKFHCLQMSSWFQINVHLLEQADEGVVADSNHNKSVYSNWAATEFKNRFLLHYLLKAALNRWHMIQQGPVINLKSCWWHSFTKSIFDKRQNDFSGSQEIHIVSQPSAPKR